MHRALYGKSMATVEGGLCKASGLNDGVMCRTVNQVRRCSFARF